MSNSTSLPVMTLFLLSMLANPLRSEFSEVIESLISRHEASRAAMRSFRVEIDVYGPKPFEGIADTVRFVTGNAGDLVLLFKTEWTVAGTSEKIVFRPTVGKVRDGLPANFSEQILRDGKEYLLQNWDREDPLSISPSVQGSVHAYISFQSKDFMHKDPGMHSLFFPRLDLSEPRFNLRQLVSRFSMKEVVSEDETQVTLRLKNDSAGVVLESQHLDVTLAKRNGCLVSCLTIVDQKPSHESEAGVSWEKVELKALNFQDLGDGLFFPSATEYSVLDSHTNVPVKTLRCDMRVVSVNQDIEEDVFTMQFPKDVVVIDSVSTPNTVKWMLWGEDNKPVREVKSKAELVSLDKNPAILPVASLNDYLRNTTVIVIAVLVIAVFFASIVFRYWKRKET